MDFNYTKYRSDILEHLVKYKENVLNVNKNGIDTRFKKEYPHILPKNKEYLNIIHSTYGLELWSLIKTYKTKLHNEFHHLNSSQALCFNLFFPIIKENKFDLLLERKEEIIGWKFEFVPNRNEKTSFDAFIQTNKNNYYFEVKYTETEFGKKEIGEETILRYNKIYKDKMVLFNKITAEIFLNNYQIFRNLSYIDTGIINFVIPKTRIDLNEQLDNVLENYCNKNLRRSINILYIEDIVERALSIQKTKEYYKTFYNKYINGATST
jgi:hypothetical protein